MVPRSTKIACFGSVNLEQNHKNGAVRLGQKKGDLSFIGTGRTGWSSFGSDPENRNFAGRSNFVKGIRRIHSCLQTKKTAVKN